MFSLKTEKIIDRQVRQISFLSQYLNRMDHIQGKENVVPDVLLRLKIVETRKLPTLRQ